MAKVRSLDLIGLVRPRSILSTPTRTMERLYICYFAMLAQTKPYYLDKRDIGDSSSCIYPFPKRIQKLHRILLDQTMWDELCDFKNAQIQHHALNGVVPTPEILCSVLYMQVGALSRISSISMSPSSMLFA